MAVNIGPKIGIDGEAEYRKQINNIIQQAKTLSSEMKKVTSSFTSETSAQDRAAAKSAVLNKQIEVQKKRVSELEKMLEKAREEFGDTANETLKWEQAVNDATTELNKLEAELKETEGETEEFGKTAEKSGEKTNEAAEKWKKVGKVAGTVGKAMGAAVAAMAVGLVKLGGALLNNAKETALWADEITTMSKVAGVSTKTLQRFEYASGLVDVSIDKIVDSLGEITASMADARSGAGDAADAYSRLGVSVTNADGSLRDSEAVFYDVIDALGEIENETERDAIAFKVFGESARELNPLIEAGADKIKELGDNAEEMGYVLSEDALDGLVGVSDAMDRLSGATESMKRNLGAAFAPFLVTVAEEVIPAIEDIAGAFAEVLSGDMSISDFVSEIVGYLDELARELRENAPQLLEEGRQIIKSITEGANEALPILNPVIIDLVNMVIETILSMLPDIAQVAITMIVQLQASLGENSELLIPAVLQCIGMIIQTIVENIWQFIGSGLRMLEGIIVGILQGIPQLSQMAPQIISTFIMGLIQNLPQIFIQGVGLIMELIFGILSAIPDLVMSLPEVIGAIVQAFKDADWKAIGNDITDGIKKGIVEKWDTLVQTIIGKGYELINRFKRLFGIKSPSRVFADEVGKMIPAGIAVGIDEATPKMLRDATNSIGQLSNVPLYNYGGVNLTVYGAQGQDVNALADVIMQKMQHAVNRKEAVFA